LLRAGRFVCVKHSAFLVLYEDYEGIVTGSANEGEHEVIGMDVSGSSGEEDDSGEECCIFDAEMPVIFSSY
jgi:hypothetical protein